MSLPVSAIKEDKRLEGEASSASEQLSRHRWHWTLNQDNPKRVSIREYARAVGRSERVVRVQVNGYVEWSTATGSRRSLSESIERAAVSAEKAELVEAVAEANEVTFQTARQNYASDVTRVREAVERHVEKKPEITPEEKTHYTKKVAKTMARSRQAAEQRETQRAERRTARFMTIDGEIAQAIRCLNRALHEARHGGLESDAVEMLESSLDRLRSLTDLVRLAIVGSVDVDWDEELMKLGQVS